MSDSLTFMMGEYEAQFPVDRCYAKNHMWASPVDNEQPGSRFRFGFTAYAVRLLQDVYFLDWTIDLMAHLRERQLIGAIESKKAESDLFAPMSGQITAMNEPLLTDPSMINVDTYGAGWLFEITGEDANLLSADEYLNHLDSVWEITQKTIKGQLNT